MKFELQVISINNVILYELKPSSLIAIEYQKLKKNNTMQ